MPDMEKVIKLLEQFRNDFKPFCGNHADWERFDVCLSILKEHDELLKHEYWHCYNNGRADERGLQEGTIMQTFSPN